MYRIEITGQFKKDLKRLSKRNLSYMDLIKDAMKLLQQSGVKGIPPKWKPHKLSGNYSDNWECHVLPDLLIIWYQVDISGVITMVRAGTHSDLF